MQTIPSAEYHRADGKDLSELMGPTREEASQTEFSDAGGNDVTQHPRHDRRRVYEVA
jgi:hypothetical protein